MQMEHGRQVQEQPLSNAGTVPQELRLSNSMCRLHYRNYPSETPSQRHIAPRKPGRDIP